MPRQTLPSTVPKLVLYSYWRSSSSHRVRFALAAKGLAYETVPVNLLEGEQSSPEHVARSPMGYVPCLLIDGTAFHESVAIIELLDELFPTPPLYPRDPYARARVRTLVEMINAGIQPLQNRYVMLHASPDGEAQKEWVRHFIRRGLAAVERAIEAQSKRGVPGPYTYGDSLTAADAFLVPQMTAARRFKVDLAPYPRVVAADLAAQATDAAKASAPERQPDAVASGAA